MRVGLARAAATRVGLSRGYATLRTPLWMRADCSAAVQLLGPFGGSGRTAPQISPALVFSGRIATSPLLGPTRGLAKKKKKGKGKAAADDDDDDADNEVPEVDMDALAKRLARPLDGLLREYASLQVGRATPGMLDALQVALPNGGGATVPLPTVAKVLAQSAQALSVNVFDAAAVPAVMKAIEASELGLAPEAAGKTVRVAVPRATEEARAAMAKQVRAAAEKCKNNLRGVRQPAMKQAKGHASKDVAKRQEKAVQDAHDATVKKVDAARDAKEKEIVSL